ncbi:MAG TPA: MBL fold metallo-hydrolase [Gemmataceae bacterium]|jgi:glyoxylase-like metal-dependent hydrolase (beta-lactamase superfamily II)
MRIRELRLLAWICVLGWMSPANAQQAPLKTEQSAAGWRVTGVLLIDQPPKGLAFGLYGEDESKRTPPLNWRVGNWDPRTRITNHATLPLGKTAWRFRTELHEWKVSADEIAPFRHHIFLVDRPEYHKPGGKEHERVLHLALDSDVVQAGDRVPVRWRWRGTKGLAEIKDVKLTAFVQQAPVAADDKAGWSALTIEAAEPGRATLTLPASLKPGLAWLRVGLAGEKASPNDRLLAEVRLVVTPKNNPAPPPVPATSKAVAIGTAVKQSAVPDAWRQGTFLKPQSVSALDVSADGRFIGVTTMAFRHDRNFWLLSQDGKVQWGRYVQPWAPFQAAVLPDGKGVGVGLAYSRFTEPNPTISLFQGEKSEEAALVDAFWDMGWLRYGDGDRRTGWPASLIGDLLVRTHNSVLTVASHDGSWQWHPDGSRLRFPLMYQRPFRMSSSGDGHVVGFGYLVPSAKDLDEGARKRLRLPPALLTVSNTLTAAELWKVDPMTDAEAVPRPPEPSDEFPAMAEDFNMKPLTHAPFRTTASVALNGDGSRVALTEYGGWLRVKRARGIGSWNPDHPVAFCPRQRGWLRVFDSFGRELARAQLPVKGLFDVKMNPDGDMLWCVPQSWFARGLAGRSWLPTDPDANTIFLYDVRRRAWTASWRFPDVVSDLALHPDGKRALVACWDNKLYLVRRDGSVQETLDVGETARVCWSTDGRFAVAGTAAGEVWSLDADAKVRWKTTLPIAEVPPLKEPLKPIFEDVPIYSVGRVGSEHAYVGDIWLIKTKKGGILVDSAGTSAVPLTWRRLKAAGVDPKEVRYVLLSHSHGDHSGGLYLWRTQGAKIVAPATAALPVTWLMPTWSDYGIWPPSPIDKPLSLKRAGDETEITLCGLPIRATFVPGHSFDLVLYSMELNGKRILFTGDLGFEGGSHILHRCWGDRDKALVVTKVVRTKVLPRKPVHVFTGHGPRRDGTAWLEDLLKRTEEALAKPQR